jgi:hypothetical protein
MEVTHNRGHFRDAPTNGRTGACRGSIEAALRSSNTDLT